MSAGLHGSSAGSCKGSSLAQPAPTRTQEVVRYRCSLSLSKVVDDGNVIRSGAAAAPIHGVQTLLTLRHWLLTYRSATHGSGRVAHPALFEGDSTDGCDAEYSGATETAQWAVDLTCRVPPPWRACSSAEPPELLNDSAVSLLKRSHRSDCHPTVPLDPVDTPGSTMKTRKGTSCPTSIRGMF